MSCRMLRGVAVGDVWIALLVGKGPPCRPFLGVLRSGAAEAVPGRSYNEAGTDMVLRSVGGHE